MLFDLGDTLEHEDVLLPGAIEMLRAVAAMKDGNGVAIALGLVSNFGKAADAAEIPQLRNEYCAGLQHLGIAEFFEPSRQRVTISSDSLDPAFAKPNASIFRAALDKIDHAMPFSRSVFVTEDLPHIQAARALGISGIHFKGPGQTGGEIEHLSDLPARILAWLAT